MSTALIPLVDFEAKAAEVNKMLEDSDSRRNGLACPVCGSGLFDTNERWVLPMYPLKRKIHCEECDFHGSREAVDVGVVRRLLQEEKLVQPQQHMLVASIDLLRRAVPYLREKYKGLAADIDGFLKEMKEIQEFFS